MVKERTEKDLMEFFKNSIDWNRLLPTGDRVLCALSGGADSVSLCDLLNRLSLNLKFNLSAVHLNHSIRGDEADEDEKFVVNFCLRNSIPLETEKIDVPAIAGQRGISLEMAARTERYGFIRRVASRIGCRTIALGHNANDRVENLLMRLLRGSGGRGLGSLRTVREHDGLIFIRPMLGFYRHDIIDYLAFRGIEYRQDSTNLDRETDRNRIRNILLPGFIKLAEDNGWHSVMESLNRSARLLAEDESMLQGMVDKQIERIHIDETGLQVKAEDITNLPVPIAGRLLLSAIEKLDQSARPEREHLSAILDICSGDRTGPIDIAGGWRAERDGAHVVIRMATEPSEPPPTVRVELDMLPETVVFGKFKLEFSPVRSCKDRTQSGVYQSEDVVNISLNADCRNLLIRSVEPGDRIAPMGMEEHTKKLSDVFIDGKVPKSARLMHPILVDPSRNNEIIALPGLKMVSEIAKVNKDSDRVIEIGIEGE